MTTMLLLRKSAAILFGLLAGLLLAQLWGCEREPGRDPVYSIDLEGVPLSEDLRDAVAAGRERLSAAAVENQFAHDLALYNALVERIHRPAERQQAGDELYSRWFDEPTHFLWIDAARQYEYLLRRKATRDSMFAEPELADSTSAIGSFVLGKRYYRYGSRGEHYRRAELGMATLDSFQQVWLAIKLAQVDSDQDGDTLHAVRRHLVWLPQAYATAGCGLAAFMWDKIAEYLLREDRLDDALHAAVLAVDMARAGGSPYRECQRMITVASVLEARREYGAARSKLEDCLRIATEADYPWIFAKSANLAAAMCGALGDAEGALALDRRNLAHGIAAADSLNTPRNLVNISYDFRQLGQLDSARVYLDRARVWVDAFDDSRNRRGLLFSEAPYYCQIGAYAVAESLLSLATGEMSGPSLAGEEAQVLLEMIRSGLEMGQPDMAYRAIVRLRELRGVLHDTLPDQNLLAEFEIATADFLARQGEFRMSRQALDRAHSAVLARGGEGMEWEYQRASGELALLRGDLSSAQEAFAEALSLAEAASNPDQAAVARFHLGHILLEEAKYAEARNLFLGPEEAAEFGGRFRTRLSSRLFLGIAFSREGRHEEALARFRQAAALITRYSPPDVVARLRIEQGRAMAALDQPRLAEQTLLDALELLRREGDQEQIAELRAFSGDAYRDVTEILLGLYVDYPSLLAHTDPGRHTLLLAEGNRWGARTGGSSGKSHEAVLSDLVSNDHSVLLAFFVGTTRSFMWVGFAETVRIYPLAGRPELLQLVAPVLLDMSRPDRPVTPELAGEIGRVLLGEVAKVWPADGLLRIVPDDVLFAMPWCGLTMESPDGGDPVSVVDHGCVVEAPSLATFRAATAAGRPAGQQRLLTVGFDSAGGVSEDSTEPRDLRHAEAEARQVAAQWPNGNAVVRVGPEASWSRIAELSLDQFGIIHIASHAMVRQGLPSQASLRLAGAQESVPLTIPAVAALELRTDLIYLSCCEAARQLSRGGSGLMSFARAFLDAGTRSVIASTIRVDDEASAVLADRFYFHWLQGQSKAEALRAAQLDVRSANPRWQHPYFWAFYRLIGNST
ncbi:MAG: CHAT domain-containing tetratricopeptide repeat protein [bacterium]